ncbi:hypothetical protein D6856_13920 [Butyrivibrio sp. XB500-5]|uniref:hypothetical protein n=1 Tax=Butyrivibrio sp. XB500-5 TaxID=2364880 RepID=UPI000EAA10ED|nr:hypothetical protein [Butyrivibrio sp. XB500-5]RKM57748.1 hypothetical protein D6856_13920 [Butyrivibrio sp. XB500-5]
MGFHDGKFYDAKLSREYYEGLKKSRTDFDVNADLVRSANNAFDANTLYNGDTARAHKRFIKNGCGKMLNDETDMMAEMTSHQEYMMSAFEGMVDADPNARIEINTLDTINRDFKGFHGRFKELTEQTHKVVTDLNNEFGAEVGGFPYPNGPAALEPLTLLCGGEDPGKGYFKDCQNMLISYDETVHGYLKSKDIPFNTQDLNKRVKATKQIINAYSYADPKVDEVKIDQLEGPKVKAVKVVNKRMEDFCKEVDKYFDKKIDQSTVIGDGKNFGDGSFLCSFEMIEASKSPQAKAVLASPYYGPAKKMITENAKPHIANSNAYMINPRDTAIAFGVGGAAQSYVENGNISGIGENAENFYQAFQQGGASYVIDSVAGTCSMPGAVTSFVPLGHGNQGAFMNLAAYPNSGNNTVLPLPSTVQGLINTNTSSAGINGQITNLWNNFGNSIGSLGQSNAGTTLNNMFQTLGYITVFGSSFFNNKSKANDPFDDDGMYGGDQGGANTGFLLFGKRVFYDKELFAFIRQHPGYEKYTDEEICELLEWLEKKGCTYVAAINSIFYEYKGREEEFEKKFGFPMVGKNGDFNYNMLLLDYFLETKDTIYLDEPEGLLCYAACRLQYYKKHPELYKKKYGKSLYDADGELAYHWYINCYDEAEAALQSGKTEVTFGEEYDTRFALSVENRLSHYCDARGIDVEFNHIFPPDNEAIQQELDNGCVVVFLADHFNLENEKGQIVCEDVGAHEMTITGITEDGRYEVSSWGEKFYFDPVNNGKEMESDAYYSVVYK